MILLLLLLFVPIVLFWNFVWKRRSFPPGPTPLPIFGNALSLKRSPYEQFHQWTAEFGPIYTIWLGEDPIVVVTDYELMRDLFIKEGDAYAGRHFLGDFMKTLKASNGLNGGVIRTQGDQWRVLRRFGLQTMRNLGVGRSGLEQQFLSDINKLIGKLRTDSLTGQAGDLNLQKHIDRLIGSTINRVLFGNAIEDDIVDDFFELKKIMNQMTHNLFTVTGKIMMNQPQFRHLPVFSDTFNRMDQNMTKIFAFLDRPIQARIAARQTQSTEERGEPKDMLDHFLNQIDLVKQGKGDPDQIEHFTMDNLRFLCFDLFLAGQETTSTTLSFLVLYLLLDQRVQEKMQAELDTLDTGRNGFHEGVTLADRGKLPYVNAVINETQRLCNLLPINLIHSTMSDVEILGGRFKLKKGTAIVPQISCVLSNEKIFANPYRFEPERFLNEEGELKRCDELIPFGLGKRICMGESLARTELFLFTANFFRNFKIFPVNALKPPLAEKKMAFAVNLAPYNCRLVVREKGEH